jgi:hypothetical protein
VTDRCTDQRLLATVAALWPEAISVKETPGNHHDTETTTQELVFVPNARRPQLLLPAGQPVAQARAMWRFSHALSPRERARRVLGATALRLGLEQRILHDRLQIRHRRPQHDSVEAHLSQVLGREVVVSLGVGSLRANQKPILQVFEAQGRTVGFVKVGDTPRSAELVRGEGQALQQVGGRPWRRFAAPRLMHLGTWRDLELLVITALPTAARPHLGRVAVPPTTAISELSEGFDGGQPRLADSRFLARLSAVCAAVSDDRQRERYGEALAAVGARYGDRPVAMGAWHGDWAPWNMSWRRGRVQLWDWEQFQTDVPLGLDAVHYLVNTRTRREGFTASAVESALDQSLARDDEPTTVSQMRSVLYLAAITGRYLAGLEHPGAEVLEGPTEAVLNALTRRVATASPAGQS